MSTFKKKIVNGDVELAAMPIIPFTGGRMGWEILLRIKNVKNIENYVKNHEVKGSIQTIDKWVFKQSCEIYGSKYDKTGYFSINVSLQSLDNKLAEYFIETTEAYSVPRRNINLELTETATINPARMDEFIKITRDNQFYVGLDDIGKSEKYKSRLRNDIDFLKVDRRLIEGRNNPSLRQSLLTICKYAQENNIFLIAEYVTDNQTEQDLRDLGFDAGQGHWSGGGPAKPWRDWLHQ